MGRYSMAGNFCGEFILTGNLFWRIGGFESNPPIFLPPKFVQSYGFPLNKLGCARPID